MSALEIYPHDETFFQFNVFDNDTFIQIKRHFTYELETYIQKKYNVTHMSILKYDRFLYLGLYEEFIDFLKTKSIKYVIKKQVRNYNKISNKAVTDFVKGLNLIFEPYWYQYEAFATAIENRRQVVLSPTSSGKTLILSMLCGFFLTTRKSKDDKLLIIVPNKTLVDQTNSDIIDYYQKSKIPMSKCIQRIHSEVAGPLDLSKPIILTTWQSQNGTSAKFYKKFGEDFISNVKYLVYDEVHGSTARVAKEIIESATNTEYRIGLTGTLHDDSEYKNTLIKGLFGDVVQFVTTRQMIDEGKATHLKIFQYPLRLGVLNYAEKDYQQEIQIIRDCENYNKYVTSMIGNVSSSDENCIVLYRGLSYGDEILQRVKTLYPNKKVLKINGGVPASARIEIRKRLEKETNIILFATYDTMSTGVSIKNLHIGVLLESMKSSLKVIQTLGRLLRKHKTKKYATLYDIVPIFKYIKDNGYVADGYVENHGKHRAYVYKKEKHEYYINKTIDLTGHGD